MTYRLYVDWPFGHTTDTYWHAAMCDTKPLINMQNKAHAAVLALPACYTCARYPTFDGSACAKSTSVDASDAAACTVSFQPTQLATELSPLTSASRHTIDHTILIAFPALSPAP